MQTNFFNGPVMQTVVFTLIPWILDRVEDDKRGDGVIIPLLLSLRGSRQAWPKQSGDGIPIVIPASERESRGREIVTGFKKIGSKRDKQTTRSIISKAILSH